MNFMSLRLHTSRLPNLGYSLKKPAFSLILAGHLTAHNVEFLPIQ